MMYKGLFVQFSTFCNNPKDIKAIKYYTELCTDQKSILKNQFVLGEGQLCGLGLGFKFHGWLTDPTIGPLTPIAPGTGWPYCVLYASSMR